MTSATTTAFASLLDQALVTLSKYEAARPATSVSHETQGFDLALQILSDLRNILNEAPEQSVNLAPYADAGIKLQVVRDHIRGCAPASSPKSIELF